MERAYRLYVTPAHGYLEVPLADLKILGIEKRISNCSYVCGKNVYLEEDCDASYFVFRAEQAGWTIHEQLVYADEVSFFLFPERRLSPYLGGTEYSYEAFCQEMFMRF
jgi:hypothetical protein